MSQDEIIFSVLPGNKGDIGEIQLNRPKALNSLTAAMCTALRQQLGYWQRDPKIKAVIIRGEGERAFCAGGDVRSLHQCRDNKALAIEFFRQEYSMNKAIFHFTKPYIALLDGITMGGGAGVSMHGSYRIATEFFSFAMPETAIGFFPDIGAGYFLNRCPGYTGYYLGLTGATINAADAMALGLVNHFVSRTELETLTQALCRADFSKSPMLCVTEIISKHETDLVKSEILNHQTSIDRCFSASCVTDLLKALKAENTVWSEEVLTLLAKRSPTSLVVTLNYLQRAKSLSFDAVMQMDFNLAHAFMHHSDFFEGVRAVLVDKDQAPIWYPATIAEVTQEMIDDYFVDQELLVAG